MTALEILVIILSTFLALFLLIGIVLAIILVRITRQIKRVTSSAERTAGSVESIVRNVGKVSSPALVAKLVMKQFSKRRK